MQRYVAIVDMVSIILSLADMVDSEAISPEGQQDSCSSFVTKLRDLIKDHDSKIAIVEFDGKIVASFYLIKQNKKLEVYNIWYSKPRHLPNLYFSKSFDLRQLPLSYVT